MDVETTLRDVSARHARVRIAETRASSASLSSSASASSSPAEGANKPTLLLLHDVLASHGAFRDLLATPDLVQMYRALAPDLPGFGESEKPSASRYRYDAPAFAESMLDVLAAVGESRAVVCGHGLGAAVALALAADHPNVVSRLVLIDPPFYGARAARIGRWLRVPMLGPFFFKQAFGRTLFRAHFRDDVYGGDFPFARAAARVDEWFDRFDGPAAREAAFATLRGLADSRALVARIPRVHVPTLILWGRDDKLVPASAGRRLAREISGARFEVFDCGHSPAEEKPEDVARAIVRFGSSAGSSSVSSSAARAKPGSKSASKAATKNAKNGAPSGRRGGA